nr:hypothetical protein [Tanacetum cinerariifolium]
KLLKDLKELAEYDQSTSTDRSIFLNDNEDHPVQNKESPENSSEENIVSKTNQEPPQDSDIHQLIEECSVEVPEEQKQNMEKMMLDLVKICPHKQFLCMHDDVDNLIESALDFKLLSINSQRLDKKEQEVKIVEEQPAEHRNQSNEVTESNAKNLLPIPSECEVTLEDKRECDELVCDNHSDTFSNSKIDDDILVYDDDFEDIKYVEASLLDPEIVSIEEKNVVEEENVVQREEEEVEDISQVQDVVLREKLLSENPFPSPPMNPNQEKSSIEEPKHSFSMGYEHFSTTLVTELDKVVESSTKNLVPILRGCEVTLDNEIRSDKPVKDDSSVFTTFLNPLFNNSDDVTSNDKESIHDVPIEESKVYSNPLFDDHEINSDELESHVESNFVESPSNHDTLVDSSQKFDYLEEFSEHNAKEERIRREHAEYISRMEMLFTINPRPHPMVNANTNIEYIPSSLIPV